MILLLIILLLLVILSVTIKYKTHILSHKNHLNTRCLVRMTFPQEARITETLTFIFSLNSTVTKLK